MKTDVSKIPTLSSAEQQPVVIPAVTREMIQAAEAVDDLYRMGQPQLWARVFHAMYAAMPAAPIAQASQQGEVATGAANAVELSSKAKAEVCPCSV
jgi:hypothetical protein